MSDETMPGPFAGLITEATEGRLSTHLSGDMRVNAEEFVYIDRDCQAFKDLIVDLQEIARTISDQAKWGLGEDQDPLSSASILVSRFREKAKGSANSVYSILEEHYKIVDEIQQLHKAIAQRYIDTDETFAARYNQLTAELPPPGPIAPTRIQPGVVPVAK
ncbi:hypothetical protein [Nocardia cyriacigeorgica]|jgi:hypothetical protein|uniref:hypothetical protein n=1 Tax=Nocardia cyriacigeorgica TaxID=135487 RepID=UPI000CEA3631|nr:hypothetical protein [Nocardia cyriacigeorgica]AVH22286.1 hypothetical protein C5B73_13380 [Nocardia cyriacigeorgica]MBF6091239.1 hypothetical protein [Nocardia cyriacigeorgica]MBF6496936.1 hypothetical protein [Nocardia cyriacigeorgica]PPJ13609.1 hypothetical protein C5E43_08205 [Nocardia cyriacigeorgica]